MALTSNRGANDFQFIKNENGISLFEEVLIKSQQWGSKDNLMFVCGATQATMFTKIRELAPENFLLVPGVGAQGGSLEEVSKYGMTKDCGIIVNSSRAIIFADQTSAFAQRAEQEAKKVQQEMSKYMQAYM